MRGAPATPFPPHVLREYAVIADGERGGLIGPHGELVWMCVPRWHHDAVFAALIGGGGCYAITPEDRYVWGGYYEDGTLIWRNRWITGGGVVECRDALVFPGHPDRAVILRRIVAVEGEARVRAWLHPRGGYGTRPANSIEHDGQVWSGHTGGVHWRWSGIEGARRERGRGLLGAITVPPGGQHDLVLELADHPIRGEAVDPHEAWKATETAWRESVPSLENCLFPRESRHSYAVLRGMTSRTGGMVAAATTSLPERAEEGRNYDYRYVWVRDQCYTGQAVAAAGPHPLLDDAVRFIAERLHEHGPDLAPAYAIDGTAVPDQRRLNLPGYPGGFDLVGNWVNKQFQLDAFGESLLLFAAAARHDRLDADGWRAAQIAVDAIIKRWRDKDAGIWEIDDQAWTHSRLICAAGLRTLAATPPAPVHASDWLALADRIIADTAAHATHPSGRWQRSQDDPGLDAALLLPPLRGALTADDPRTLATLQAYERELTEDGYAYRFRHDQRPLGQAEGAFLLCGFVMALATHQQGRLVDATGWFERTRAACGPPVLYSEEFDVAEHQLRGNLPQAFVHALLLECSATLGR